MSNKIIKGLPLLGLLVITVVVVLAHYISPNRI